MNIPSHRFGSDCKRGPRHHISDDGLDTLCKQGLRGEAPQTVRYAGTAAAVPVAVYSSELLAVALVPLVSSFGSVWGRDELPEAREGPLRRELVDYVAAVEGSMLHTFPHGDRRPD